MYVGTSLLHQPEECLQYFKYFPSWKHHNYNHRRREGGRGSGRGRVRRYLLPLRTHPPLYLVVGGGEEGRGGICSSWEGELELSK
jgi:hypothetical protein